MNRTVRRDVLEDRPPFTVRDSRLSDESIHAFTSRPRRRMHERPVDPTVKRLKELEAALAALPTPSTVVRGDDVLKRLPEAVALHRRMVACLGDASIDVERGREPVRGLLGEIQIAPRNGHLVGKMGLVIQPLSGSSIRGSGGALLRLEADWIEVELR